MKYFISLLILILIVGGQSVVFCDESLKPSAYALEWWLRGQGKFEGASVCTKYSKDKYKITKWKVDGVPKPSKNELAQIIEDYEAQYVPPKTLLERIEALEEAVKVLEEGR